MTSHNACCTKFDPTLHPFFCTGMAPTAAKFGCTGASRVYRCSSAFRGRRVPSAHFPKPGHTKTPASRYHVCVYPDRAGQSLIPIYDRDRCNRIITTTLARAHIVRSHTQTQTHAKTHRHGRPNARCASVLSSRVHLYACRVTPSCEV